MFVAAEYLQAIKRGGCRDHAVHGSHADFSLTLSASDHPAKHRDLISNRDYFNLPDDLTYDCNCTFSIT